MLQQLLELLILVQAELLVWLQPAQWMGRFLKRNRAHVVFTIRPRLSSSVGTIPERSGGGLKAVIETLKGIKGWGRSTEPGKLTGKMVDISAAKTPSTIGFRVIKACVVSKDHYKYGFFHAWYFTETFKWVDDIEWILLPTPSGSVIAEAYSCSTSFIPASIPFAPLIALFFWWLPFDDHYNNYKHLRDLRYHLEMQGFEVEENVLIHGGCLYPFQDKIKEETGVVDFHAAVKSQ